MLDETRQSSATAQVSQSEISALQDRVQALMSSVEEKKNELKQLQADNKKAWEEQLRQNRAEVAEKENQLKTEIALRKIAQSNFDRLTKQTDSHIKDQQEKSNRQIESLHEQVAEAESEKTEAQNKVQKAMKDSEQAIKTTKDKHKAELGDLHRRLQDIESSRQQVVQQLKDAEKAAGKELHLRSEESKRLIELEQQRRIVVQQDLERLQNSIAGLSKGRSASADTTQTIKASQSQNTDSQFKRPRKKVDRQSQSVIQVPGTSSGHQRRTSQENHRGDEYSQGQYQAVFETFIDTGDDNAENHRFAPKPVPFSQFDNHGAVAERLDDGSGSPLSEPRSESDASKENVRIATPGALRGVREDSSILRELTVNATTPVRTEETPVRAPPQRDSSSLGRTDVLENPFEIYNSPNGEIEMPSLFRPQSNTASRRMAHDVPRQARDVPTTALSQSHHEGPQDMDTSFLKRQEPMRRSLIAEQPADFRREPAKGSDHSSTPDYVQGEPLQSQRVTTYGHRSSSRPNSGNSRRASSIVRATPAAEQHAFQTLQRSRSKQLKRPATPGTVPVNFTPRIKRLRTREERNYAEVSSQSDAQSGVTTQTMSRGPSVKASQSQSQAIKKSESQSQSVFKQSESQSQRANPNDVPLSTRARVGSSGGLKRATGRGGSSKGRKVNERYSTRFSQI